MNGSSRSRESSPAFNKESSPLAKEGSPQNSSQRTNIKLKRSSPVLSTKLSSPFPYAKKMESVKKTLVPIKPSSDAIQNGQPAAASEICTPVIIDDACSSDDELLSSKVIVNRKRSTLSRHLSSSADNVLDIQEDKVSHSTISSLSPNKKRASRSKSTENLSVVQSRGTSFRRSFRRKNQVTTTGSPKSPPAHDGNKLISLAQGILTNLRIPGFSRQQSGSEPPLRSSWCLKVYDGTNELEKPTNKDSTRTDESSTKAEQKSTEEFVKRHRNSELYMFMCEDIRSFLHLKSFAMPPPPPP